jgi:DNA segregation ATPase FtsK/SpoIIIE-like protein
MNRAQRIEVGRVRDLVSPQHGGVRRSSPVHDERPRLVARRSRRVEVRQECEDDDERDEFFDDAARLIVLHQQGSTSLIQRKLKLGYNRAGRIIDQLERAGVLGPFEGTKARKVLIPDEASLEHILQREGL